MTTTSEVRWFFEGALPEALWTWFKQHAKHPSQVHLSTGTDHYLLFPLSACTGVKLREGRLEVKSYAEDSWVEAEHPGNYQVWEKWSQHVGEGFAMDQSEGDWLEVRKKRGHRVFAHEAGVFKEIMPDSNGRSACHAELVEISVNGRLFYSLGFEATGEPAERIRLLLETVNRMLDTVPEALVKEQKLFFSQENSCSYPEWLLELR